MGELYRRREIQVREEEGKQQVSMEEATTGGARQRQRGLLAEAAAAHGLVLWTWANGLLLPTCGQSAHFVGVGEHVLVRERAATCATQTQGLLRQRWCGWWAAVERVIFGTAS